MRKAPYPKKMLIPISELSPEAPSMQYRGVEGLVNSTFWKILRLRKTKNRNRFQPEPVFRLPSNLARSLSNSKL